MAILVNGERISDEQLEESFDQIKGQYERVLQVACCERDAEFREMAKEQCLMRTLMQQEARRRYPQIEEELIQAKLASLMEFEVAEDEQAEMRAYLADGLRLERLMEDLNVNEMEASEADLHAFYQEKIQHFYSHELRKALQLSVEFSSEESKLATYQKMRDLRQRILAGEDFKTLAQQYQTHADQSIEMDWFKQGDYMAEFDAIIFSMNIDEVSPVFATQLGYHLCQLVEVQPSKAYPFEEVRADVQALYLDQQRDDRFNRFVDELRSQAQIEELASTES